LAIEGDEAIDVSVVFFLALLAASRHVPAAREPRERGGRRADEKELEGEWRRIVWLGSSEPSGARRSLLSLSAISSHLEERKGGKNNPFSSSSDCDCWKRLKARARLANAKEACEYLAEN